MRKLNDYINFKREKGVPDQEIKETLIKGGWNDELLKQFFK